MVRHCTSCTCQSAWHRLEYIYGRSYKFWEVRREGSSVYVRYGRIGTEGTTIVKRFMWATDAVDYMEQKMAEKVRAGYERV